MKRINPFLLPLLFIVAMVVGISLHGCSSDQINQDSSDQMAAEHRNDQPVATPAAKMEPAQPVTTETVQYATVNGQAVTGYFAKPQGISEPLPGLITIHEWWGLNDNIEAMTRRLAGEGYQVLAVDLYNNQTAQSPDQARQLVQSVMQNPADARANLQQAYQYLAGQQNASKVGVIGWCFGGGWALRTALLLPEKLDAAVIYYGELVTNPDQLKTLQMPILGIFGAEDQTIPVAQVQEFESTLDSLGKTAEINIYDNAGHAFANPSGNRYVPEAATAAWQATTQFLNQYLAES